MTREKNPKYESMSLEELKANMEKSKKELEQAMHNKNILEQRKKLIERKERSHRLVVKGAEFEKAFPMSKDLEQEDFQKVMNEMKVLKEIQSGIDIWRQEERNDSRLLKK